MKFKHTNTLATLLALTTSGANSTPLASNLTLKPTHLIHAFPGVALENLAVRSNGHILVTATSAPNLYSVDPCTGASTTIASFPNPYNLTGALGITETTPDVFFVVVGTDPYIAGGHVSWALYKVDFTGCSDADEKPVVTKHQDLPGTGAQNLPNGLTTVDAQRGLVLVADFFNSTVYRADTLHKTLDVALRSPELGNVAGGANGVKVRDGEMYVSNYGGGYFVRSALDGQGIARGNVSEVRTGYAVDDFAFDNQRDSGRIYAAANPNSSVVLFEGKGYGSHRVLAEIENASAVEFGRTSRNRRCLYVTAPGGLYGVDVDATGACSMPNR